MTVTSAMRIVWLTAAAMLLFGGCSSSPEAKEAKYLARGKKQMERKDYPRAILEFKNAVRAKPKDAEAYYQLALAQLAGGNPHAAVVLLRKAAELNPKHAGAQLKIAELIVAKADPKYLPEAQRRALDVLSFAPDNVTALNTLGLSHLRLGRSDDAGRYFESALRYAPKSLVPALNLAAMKMMAKDLSGAERILQRAIQQNPGSDAPLIALGHFYTNASRIADAAQQFNAALRINPRSAGALLGIAEAHIRAGHREQAEEVYRRIAQLPDARYKPLHAMYLFQMGKYDAAIAEYAKLASADPSDRDSRTRLVLAYLAVGRPSDAERVITAALKRNMKDVDALLQRSLLYIDSRRYAEAQADLARVLQYRPDSAEARFLLSRVHRGRGSIENQRTELAEALRQNPGLLGARLELAEAWMAQSPKTSLRILDEAPGNQKDLLTLVTQRNWALAALNETAELRKGVEKGLSITRTPDLLLQDAILKMHQNQLPSGRAALEEALRLNPQDLRVLSALARSHLRQNQAPAALDRIRAHAKQFPASAPIQQFLGDWLVSSGHPDEARKAFADAKAADPHFTSADLALAELDISEKKLESARTALIAAVKRNETDLRARLLLGQAEELTGHYDAAMEHYRKAIEVDPANVLALNNFAYYLADHAGRPDEALRYAQKAKELAPDDAAVDDTIGWALFQKGIYGTAIRHFEAAVAKAPRFTPEGLARCQYHLAMAYFKAGDNKKGEAELRAALKAAPGLPEAKDANRVRSEAGQRSK